MGDRKTGIGRKRGAKAFLQLAEADLEDSKAAFKGKRWHSSCYHAEQCSEKAVKGLLFLENKFVEEHEVAELLKEVAKEKNWKIGKLIEKAKILERYWNIPRYPDPYNPDLWNPIEDITKEEAKDALENAKFILEKIKQILIKKYNLDVG